MSFEEFSKDVEDATNKISLKQSSTTARKGRSKLRDRLIFGKVAWQESLSFVGILQTIIIFVALIPQAVITMNGMFVWLGINYQFPVNTASVVVVSFIAFIFLFGFIAVRYIGTITSAAEIGAKMSPGTYLLYEKLCDLEKKVVEIENKNRKDTGDR